MITLSFFTTFTLIALAFVLGVVAVAAAVVLTRRSLARRDAELLRQGFNRMSQAEIDRRATA